MMMICSVKLSNVECYDDVVGSTLPEEDSNQVIRIVGMVLLAVIATRIVTVTLPVPIVTARNEVLRRVANRGVKTAEVEDQGHI